MNPVTRRHFMRTAGAAVGTAMFAEPTAAESVPPRSFDGAAAMLYDATRCIGCRSCARACREHHNLPVTKNDLDGVSFDMPVDLDPKNLMVVQAHRASAAAEAETVAGWSFIKKNCMHCNQPACASVCPVAALHKTDQGAVQYDESRCIGCRYCLLACPYGVPRYEWVDRMPRVRKCDFARVCIAACPVRALQGGTRRELIGEAHRRIHENPGRYVDHVYGEHEAGGTSYLIVSGVPLERFGFPTLSPTARSGYAEALMGAVPGWIIGLGLFLGGLYRVTRRQESDTGENPAEDETS